MHNNLKNNGSVHLKLEHIVVYKLLVQVRHWVLSNQGLGEQHDFEFFSPITTIHYRLLMSVCLSVCVSVNLGLPSSDTHK